MLISNRPASWLSTLCVVFSFSPVLVYAQEAEELPQPEAVTPELRIESGPIDFSATDRAELELSPTESDDAGLETLTRGPLHEAFAEPIAATPAPGLIIPREPPAPINEQAPDYRPEDSSAIWISGYWGWDDERSDFLWVSGVYRVPPIGYRWVPGYWNTVEGGWQWIQGFWISEQYVEIEYLPPPPESLEVGPSSPAPGSDYFYIPGYWSQSPTDAYQWNVGYWHPMRDDYVWVPCHYVWTPSGCVFVDGYWDRRLPLRGLCFAPVTITNYTSLRPGWAYRPRIVLNAQLLLQHLFIRPRYNHYLFGDYYAFGPSRRDVVPAYLYHQSRGGFDPLISFYVAYNALQGQDMLRWYGNHHAQLQRNPSLRPPRTWATRIDSPAQVVGPGRTHSEMAHRVEHLALQPRDQSRISPVSMELKRELNQRSNDIRRFAKERENIERQSQLADTIKPERGPTGKLMLPKQEKTSLLGPSSQKSKLPERPQRPEFRPEVRPDRSSRPSPLPSLGDATRSLNGGDSLNGERGLRSESKDNKRSLLDGREAANRLQNSLKVPTVPLPSGITNPPVRTESSRRADLSGERGPFNGVPPSNRIGSPNRVDSSNRGEPLNGLERLNRSDRNSPSSPRDRIDGNERIDRGDRSRAPTIPRDLNSSLPNLDGRILRDAIPTPQRNLEPRSAAPKITLPKTIDQPPLQRGPDRSNPNSIPKGLSPDRSSLRMPNIPSTPRMPDRIQAPPLPNRNEPIRPLNLPDLGQSANRIRNTPSNIDRGAGSPKPSPASQPRTNANERRFNPGGENNRGKRKESK
jgi:hypothetical protein